MNTTSNYYETNAIEISRRYENADVRNLHATLLEIFSSGSKLLEIGSGSGREASFLINNNYYVECLEDSQNMIDQSTTYHPELIGHITKCKVPLNFPNKKNYYDGIYAIASLMHMDIKNLRLTFKKIKISLKHGGVLFFSVPITRGDLESTGFDSKNRFFLLLSVDEWINLLKDTGFTNISTTTSIDGMGRKDIIWLNCFAQH